VAESWPPEKSTSARAAFLAFTLLLAPDAARTLSRTTEPRHRHLAALPAARTATELRSSRGATIAARERSSFAMITAAKSFARAREWMARADRAPLGRFKQRLERIARSWAKLAVMAEDAEAAGRRREISGA